MIRGSDEEQVSIAVWNANGWRWKVICGNPVGADRRVVARDYHPYLSYAAAFADADAAAKAYLERQRARAAAGSGDAEIDGGE